MPAFVEPYGVDVGMPLHLDPKKTRDFEGKVPATYKPPVSARVEVIENRPVVVRLPR